MLNAGHVQSHEYERATSALNNTPESPVSIGFELEIPRLEPSTIFTTPAKAASRMLNLGFYRGFDEKYEIISPPASHPTALSVATAGLTQCRLVPRHTRSEVPMHISVGLANEDRYTTPSMIERLTRILRAVELAGAATPQRLLQPLQVTRRLQSKDAQTGWNVKGIGGIVYVHQPFEDTRIGDRSRIEFRTPCFVNLPNKRSHSTLCTI
jgi:hypothetical protein